MPKPKDGEGQDEFIQRCIPMMINEGKEPDQAVAICQSLWENRMKANSEKSHKRFYDVVYGKNKAK